jgi:uncharacterized protein YcaQ
MTCQGLSAPPRRKLAGDDLLRMIERLGFVQIDSINTVARAHHMILFARNQTYRPSALARLLERDRTLFEHWTHDAAAIPTGFYPYWQHRFERDRQALLARWRKHRREGFEEALSHILEHVNEHGPTMARDIGSGRRTGSGWWDWHPEKTALEYHWRTGALAICRREGFQKVYNLTTRIIPQEHLGVLPGEAATVDWACRSALERLGTATAGEISEFWDLVSKPQAAEWCDAARESGEIVEVMIEPAFGERPWKAFAFADVLERLEVTPAPPERLRVLSPFDPLIRDRKRCKRLFGFDYRIEIFVPEAKRQYGYYVFPLLERDRFVGRIDMKHEKKDNNLHVHGLWPEPGVSFGRMRQRALEAELDRCRRFVAADRVVFADGWFR